MERMDNVEELLAIFQQTRLAPLGNTFLKVEQAEQPADPPVVRRRRSIQLKANSIPEYIPHQLVSMYGDSDIFEDVDPPDFGHCLTDVSNSNLTLEKEKKEEKAQSPPKASPATHFVQDPAVLEPAFVGRTFSENSNETHEPAFVGTSQLVDNAVSALRSRRNRQMEPAAVPTPELIGGAPGLEAPVSLPLSAPPGASPAPVAPAQPQNQEAHSVSCPAAGHQHTKSSPAAGQPVTTLMIRNLPHELLQSQLAADIDACGFKGLYDFLYMPSTFGTGRGKGYAFVNFATPEIADCFSAMWHNTCRFGSPNEHVFLNVSVACIQGRDANVARWDTSKMRRIRNANHRPLVTVIMADSTNTRPPMLPPSGNSALGPMLATSPAAPAPLTKAAAALANVAPPVPMADSEPHWQLHETTAGQLEESNDISNPHAMVGQWCRINSPQHMTQPNGLWGMVEAYHESLERYIMRVPMDSDHWFMAKVLRENLDIPTQSC